MKQAFSLLMGQMADDTKHRLSEDKEWEVTKQQKELIIMLDTPGHKF